MTAAALSHDAFAPVELPGRQVGLAFALAAHALLIAALAWSVSWKTSEPEGVVAELWAALPQTAMPRATPTPPPTPTPTPTPLRERTEPVTPPARPDTAGRERADAQIAVERAAREKARLDEVVRADAAREASRRDEKRRAEAAERESQRLAQAEREKHRLADEQQAKKQEQLKARQDEARSAAAHEANVRRMMAQAGGSSDSTAPGSASRTAGPSASYGGRIKAYLRPFIKTPGSLSGNFTTEVEIRLIADGTIVNSRITRPSGSAIWDETVLRAVNNAKSLPRDTNGTVQSPMLLTFKSSD